MLGRHLADARANKHSNEDSCQWVTIYKATSVWKRAKLILFGIGKERETLNSVGLPVVPVPAISLPLRPIVVYLVLLIFA